MFAAFISSILSIGVLTPLANTRLTLRRTGTVSALLADMSAQSGVSLSVSEGRGKEILIVSVDGASLAQTMDRVADATFGKWENVGTGYRLVRDPDKETAAEQEYTARMLPVAQREVGRVVTRVMKAGLTVNTQYPGPAQPYDRAVARVLSAIPLAKTIPTKPDEDCVFSNVPTAAQRPLPNGDAALQEYLAEMAKLGVADNPQNPTNRIVLHIGFFPNKAAFFMTIYRADGSEAMYGQHVRFVMDPQNPLGDPPSELMNRLGPKEPVPLSPDSRFFDNPAELSKSPSVLSQLRNPETHDPLATMPADVWNAVANRTHRNLVANLDDRFFVPFWTGQAPPLRESLRIFWQTATTVDENWIVARPDLANPPWCHRIDRSLLGQHARTPVPARQLDRFINAAPLVASTSGDNARWVLLDYWKWIFPQGSGIDLNFHWDPMRVYGLLSPPLRRTWIQGGSIPISELSTAARRALRAWTVGEEYTTYTNVKGDPTFRFPNGLPDRGYLTAKRAEDVEFYTTVVLDHYPIPQFLGIDSLAQTVLYLEAADPKVRDSLRVALYEPLDFALGAQFSDTDRFDGLRVTNPTPSNDQLKPFNELPAHIREIVLARVEQLREKQKGAAPGY